MTADVALAPVPTRTTVGFPRLVAAELRWAFRRPRTLVVLGLLALIPIVVGIALTVVDAPSGAAAEGGPGSPDGGLLAAAAGNALVLPIAVMTMTLGLLLPLVAAMAAADALAGETAHGTLRGWLLAPVSRGRLLAVKTAGVFAVILAAVVLVSLTAFLTGLVMSGPDGMITLSGTTPSVWSALGSVLTAAGWVAVQLFAVGAVALAVSAYTEHPMLVLASVLAGTILFTLLGSLEALSWLHPFLLTDSWMSSMVDLLRDPAPASGLLEGLLRAACYALAGLSIAYAKLTTKDG